MDALEAFLEDFRSGKASPKTVLAVKSDLGGLVRWFETETGQRFDLGAIDSHHVVDWMRHIERPTRRRAPAIAVDELAELADGEPTASPATSNRRRNSLRLWARWAIAKGQLGRDPTEDVDEVERVERAPRAISPEAIRKLLTEARRQEDSELALRDEAFIAVIAHLGLRIQEACDLRVAHVQVDERLILVARGKGGRPRETFVTAELLPVIERYARELRFPGQDYPEVGDPARAEYFWLHREPRGGANVMVPGLSQRAAREMFVSLAGAAAARCREEARHAKRPDARRHLLAMAAELDRATPHTLRHSLARRLLEEGKDLPVVQRALGHRSLQSTGVYVVPGLDTLGEALEQGGGLGPRRRR